MKYNREYFINLGINKLINWVKSKKWDIHFGQNYEDEMNPFLREIYINTRFKKENQLYALLHECGHLLLHLNKKKYTKTYPYAAKIDSAIILNKNLIKTSKYQVDLISEEIDAWRKGEFLAKKLNIFMDKNNYNKEMYKYIFSYIKKATIK